MDILRFTTAGNVDDGKSTLIGRLLYNTGNIKTDILTSVTQGETDDINLAHVTDGLRAERQNGITIDVAYKYMTVPHRKFIITDAPGHFEYTRNLVTGASSVDVMIILVDVLNGITEQTQRHTKIASFLGIKHIVVAVNKMDAVAFDCKAFDTIASSYKTIATQFSVLIDHIIPISALKGDNVTRISANMDWYVGPTLLEYLCSLQIPQTNGSTRTLAIIQYAAGSGVYMGKLLSGSINVGDKLLNQATNDFVFIHTLYKNNTKCSRIEAGDNFAIAVDKLEKLDRGSLLVSPDLALRENRRIEAEICWMDSDTSLRQGNTYYLRINVAEYECVVSKLEYKTDISSTENKYDCQELKVNDFGSVIIESKNSIYYETFSEIVNCGRGILVDKNSKNTVAAIIIKQ